MDGDQIRLEKRAMRKQMRTRRDAIPQTERLSRSMDVCARAMAHPAYRAARWVHCYLPIDSEMNCTPLLQHALQNGKRVAVPIFIKGSSDTPVCEIVSLDAGEFVVGDWGLSVPRVMRPVAIRSVDIFFVPLLAASPVENGYVRLGYGIGYYDRLLSGSAAVKLGLAFAEQQAERLPREPHDVLLDDVIMG